MYESNESLIAAFTSRGQGHVFKYIDELSDEEKLSLFEQLKSIDLDEVEQLVNTYVKGDGESALDFSKLEPAPYKAHFSNDPESKADWDEAYKVGEDALRKGQVAAFTVAGGQGTRLGYDGPKGTYPVAPISNATLFEVFAKKVLFTEKRYGAPVYWFVMTSIVNHEATVSFFEENHYFGLKKDRVQFFSQGLMPAVDFDGKLILDTKHQVVMTPDGHGGSLRALNRSGAIAKMEELGIKAISYFQVDNPLVKFLDPYFIGYHLQGNAELSSKMIPKAYPLEKVGHFCMLDGKQIVVEYSDLPNERQEELDEDGNLRFVAGSIAIHIFDVGFVKKLASEGSELKLPFHKAVKKIPFIDDSGARVKPTEPNGVKFEMFVFDSLPFAERSVLIETLRSEDFSPVKNAEGVDSPETCKQHQKQMWAKWLKVVGVEVDLDDSGIPTADFEVDPEFASDEISFVEAWKQLDPKPVIENGVVLKSQ